MKFILSTLALFIAVLSLLAQPNPINRRAMAISGLAQGPFTPAQLPNLQFWFKADTGVLKADLTTSTTDTELYVWQDQTSAHYNVTNSSLTTFATNRASGPNGSNYISAYDGLGLVNYTNSINVSPVTNWTMFFVVRRGGNINAGGMWFGRRTPTQSGTGSETDFIRFQGGNNPGAIDTAVAGLGTAGALVFANNGPWTQVTWTTSVIRTNGIPYLSHAWGVISVTNGFCILDMYDSNTTPVRYYVDMVEAFGSSTDLTGTSSLTNAELYLKNKYGL